MTWTGLKKCRPTNRSGLPEARAILVIGSELVLEAMLADPIAAQLPYEKIIEMTDEMLAATARWLPHFDA